MSRDNYNQGIMDYLIRENQRLARENHNLVTALHETERSMLLVAVESRDNALEEARLAVLNISRPAAFAIEALKSGIGDPGEF